MLINVNRTRRVESIKGSTNPTGSDHALGNRDTHFFQEKSQLDRGACVTFVCVDYINNFFYTEILRFIAVV